MINRANQSSLSFKKNSNVHLEVLYEPPAPLRHTPQPLRDLEAGQWRNSQHALRACGEFSLEPLQ